MSTDYYSYLSMIGLDTSTLPEGPDHLLHAVMLVTDAPRARPGTTTSWTRPWSSCAGVQAMNDAAEAEGFTWTDDLQAQLDEHHGAPCATAASTYGYTEQQYLGLIYGSTMTTQHL